MIVVHGAHGARRLAPVHKLRSSYCERALRKAKATPYLSLLQSAPSSEYTGLQHLM